jgi:hypothetical protein
MQKIATSIQRLLQFLLLCFSAIVLNAVVTPWFLTAAVPICVVYYVMQHFYRCSSRLVTISNASAFGALVVLIEVMSRLTIRSGLARTVLVF